MQLAERYKINTAESNLSEPPEPYPEESRRLLPAMKAYLHGRRLSYTTAKGNYWYATAEIKEEDPTPRVTIPCVNPFGRPYWQGRAMLSSHKLRYRSAKGGRFQSIVVVWPSYVNFIEVVSKKERKPVVIIEGPMDALAAAGMGYLSISTMGALFSEYALIYLDRNVPKDIPVIIIPDVDCLDFGVSVVKLLSIAGRKCVMRVSEEGDDLAAASNKERKHLLRKVK